MKLVLPAHYGDEGRNMYYGQLIPFPKPQVPMIISIRDGWVIEEFNNSFKSYTL